MVPDGIVWSDVTSYIMQKYALEISGGLGPTVGKVWRIGIMGHNARPGNIELVLAGTWRACTTHMPRGRCTDGSPCFAALKDALQHVGYKPPAHSEL